jgi:hypothetical protein
MVYSVLLCQLRSDKTGTTGAVYARAMKAARRPTQYLASPEKILETTTHTLDTMIKPDEVQDLPLSGRDALLFAQLVPGAQFGANRLRLDAN